VLLLLPVAFLNQRLESVRILRRVRVHPALIRVWLLSMHRPRSAELPTAVRSGNIAGPHVDIFRPAVSRTERQWQSQNQCVAVEENTGVRKIDGALAVVHCRVRPPAGMVPIGTVVPFEIDGVISGIIINQAGTCGTAGEAGMKPHPHTGNAARSGGIGELQSEGLTISIPGVRRYGIGGNLQRMTRNRPRSAELPLAVCCGDIAAPYIDVF